MFSRPRVILVCVGASLAVGASAGYPSRSDAHPAAAAPQAASQPKPPSSEEKDAAEKTAQWVRQLGDDSFEARREAAKQLAGLGLKAQAALAAGLRDADPQVRRQCRWILVDVIETDFQRRLDAFVAGTEDKQDYRLPGWERYRQVIGSDKPARELFVQMQRAEGGLMESAVAGPAAAAESVSLCLRRVTQLMSSPHPRQKTPSLGTIAALLFIATDPRLKLPQQLQEHGYLMNAIHQPEFQKALGDGPMKPCARKLLGQWILSPGSIGTFHTKMHLAIQHDIAEGLDLALWAATAKDPQMAQPYMRAFAINAIGKLGGKEYAATLEGLIEEQADIFRAPFNNMKDYHVQVRDVALAWLIHLTGQSHAAYHQELAGKEFDEMQKNPRNVCNHVQLGFGEAAHREEALRKWRAYVAANPLPKPPSRASAEVIKATGDKRVRPPAALAPNIRPNIEAQDNPLRGVTLEMADRVQVRRLARARELCQRGSYTEAAQLLSQILTAKADYAFQPDAKVPLLRCLKPEAEALLAELPDEGREAYRLLCDAEAEQALAKAVRAGDIEAVATVAGGYFHTAAGAEATHLLALHHLDRGHPFAAALTLQRLRSDSQDAPRLEPALSLELAACWVRLGMRRAAEEVLHSLRARKPEAAVVVGNRERDLFREAGKALAWLEPLLGRQWKAAAEGGWLMFRGGPTRSATADVGSPYLRAKSLAAMCPDNELSQAVGRLRKTHADEYRVALPAMQPVVTGDCILYRTATHLAAMDTGSGKMLWEAPLEDPLLHFLQSKGRDAGRFQSDTCTQSVRRRFWEDLSFGTISSDGRYVFGVENVAFDLGADYQRIVVGPDGQRRVAAEALNQYNLLTGYDIRTGKLRWEVGGAPGPGAIPLAGARFLGPPLPLGGRLYAVADISNETRLLELDAETGNLLNELRLALREKPAGSMVQMFWGGGVPQWMTDNLARRSASSPSYADGVLVCRAGDNQYIGVNLATRAVLWVYQMPDQDGAPIRGWMFGIFQRRRMLEAINPDQAGRWADGSVTIADGRVLLTPPDANELYCLNLRDGRLLWTAPRRSGIYVGGVADGRVVVVGRGDVWALKLADGKPAWAHERLALPVGALPSGFGLMTGGQYLLPLRICETAAAGGEAKGEKSDKKPTGEVAVIDMAQGRLAARSRAPEGLVPGNLIAFRDAVYSQDAEGLWQFPTLASRDRQLLAALVERPDDPDLLTERGEVLMDSGRVTEAVTLLRRAVELRPAPRTRQALAEALLDGLRNDFAAFAPLAEQLGPLVEKTEGRSRLLRELAVGLERSGQLEQAFSAYLKLIDLGAKPDDMERVETARVVRRDRWLCGRLAEIHQAAGAAARGNLDRQIAARMQDDRLPQFLAWFGWHASAPEARLRLARQLISKQQRLEAEQLLWAVVRSGGEGRQAAALGNLAVLLREAKQTQDAARVYARLNGELAKVACLDGKTGGQLFEALGADDPVRRAVAAPYRWPAGKVRKEASDKPKGGYVQSFSVPVANVPVGRIADPSHTASLAAPLFVDVDMGNRTVSGCDSHGQSRWKFSMAERDQQWMFTHYPDPLSQVWAHGHLLVMWLGNRLAAVDVLGDKAKVLWTQETFKQHPQLAVFGFPMRMQGQVPVLPASEPRPLAVTPGGVCFLRDTNLTAIDPLTGQVLWTRDDATADSSLFGDEELLLVAPPDGNEAMVLSVLDGRELGRRRVPPAAERMWTLGPKVVTWSTAGGAARLALVDPWAEQTLWEKSFDPKAQPWLVDGEEVAVFEPTAGRLAIHALPSGAPILDTKIEPQPNVEGIFVQRSADGYVLALREPAAQAQPMFIMQPFQGFYPVHGRVCGLDRGGKLLWLTKVEKQGLKPNQPSDLPVLVFFHQGQVLDGQTFRHATTLLCLDNRSGRVLHSSESKNYANFFDLRADREKSEVQVRTQLGEVKFTFTAEAEAEAKAK